MENQKRKTPYNSDYIFQLLIIRNDYWNRENHNLSSICEIDYESKFDDMEYFTAVRPFKLFRGDYYPDKSSPIFNIRKDKSNNYWASWYIDGNITNYICKLKYYSNSEGLFYSKPKTLLLNMGRVKRHENGFIEPLETYKQY